MTLSLARTILSLFLAAMSAGDDFTTPPQELQALFAEAVRRHQARDWGGAAEAYGAFLERQPRNVEARSNLGAVLAAEGRYEEAIAQYREALSIDASKTAVRFNLAVSLLKAGRPAEAAPELERVVNEKPDHRSAVVLLAECRARLGQYASAASLLGPLNERNPDDRAVTYLLGLALVQDKQVEKGQRLLDRILRDGESAETRLLLGVVKLQAGEYPEARDDLRRAAELNPNLALVHVSLGRALMNTGDVIAAAEAFERELAINPNEFDANLLLGVLLKQDQRLPEAMERFSKAAAIRPGDAAAQYQIGALELQLGRTAEAQEILERVVAAAPDFTEAHVSLATAYYRLKRKEDGDRHRALARELTAKQQAKEPGVQAGGDAYRGEPVPVPSEVKKDAPKPPEKEEGTAARPPGAEAGIEWGEAW